MRLVAPMLVLAPLAWSAPAPPLADEARQILVRRCVACHSAQVKTAGLDLSTRDGFLQRRVRILERIGKGEMPPAKPLPDAELDVLRRWEQAGAPAWSGGTIAPQRSGPDWWSFQPLRALTPGASIDHWIETKLREKKWRMAPEADRRALIRRVTFGLTGLPPTPEEITAFAGDQRPDAYERLVDRLLASPAYGEHWARHWLDVVRFSESEGFERDWLRDHAWPYRDYVIRAFNDDKPYGQFVREQIAGDVLETPTHDGIVATSLLALGPYDAVGFTSAVERERDQVRADQMEEMVGVVAQTFLGLTVNCARCHDHKFDPIPQRDYYRLKAVFEGVWPPTIGSELKADGRLVLTPDELASHRTKVDALKQRIRDLESALAAADRAERPAVVRPEGLAAQWSLDFDARDDIGHLHAPSLPDVADFANGRLSPAAGKDSVTVTTIPLDFDLREKTLEAWVWARTKPDKGVTLVQIRNRNAFRGSALDGIRLTGGPKRLWVNTSTVDFRTEVTGGAPEDLAAGDRANLAITYAASGEIRLYRNGIPYGRAYTPDAGSAHGRLQTYGRGDAIVELTSGGGLELEQARIFSRALPPEEIARLHAAGVNNAKPIATPERVKRLEVLAAARAELKATESAPAKAFAAVPRSPAPTHLLIRGDVGQPGDLMAPGAVSCIRDVSGDLELAADAPEAERRRRLADWLTRADNPLPWRVMANRVWHYHFGAGLVENPNDFGFNGGLPSHPELLDQLAVELRQGGLKQLQKRIVMSRAYRQSSRFDSAAAAQDVNARFLWRFPPQRLPAEAVRDAMLAASGALNPEMYGPSFRPFQIIKNAGSYHSYDPVDSSDAALQRRTLYRMNINSGGNPMLDALDCPLPSMKTPKRSTTTTALQALSLMNNPFASRMAKTLAARVTRERATPAERIERAYQLALGRPPRDEEAQSALALGDLETVCWALFNLSEFVYVE